jgi:hypothetical protein
VTFGVVALVAEGTQFVVRTMTFSSDLNIKDLRHRSKVRIILKGITPTRELSGIHIEVVVVITTTNDFSVSLDCLDEFHILCSPEVVKMQVFYWN